MRPAENRFSTRQNRKAAIKTAPLNIPVESPVFPSEVTSNQSLSYNMAPYDIANPSSPPSRVKTMFSDSTCQRMVPCVAPKARRTPRSAIRRRILDRVKPDRFKAGTSRRMKRMMP